MSIEEMKKWLKNKDVKIWKRTILLLCETGRPMKLTEIANALGVRRTSVSRTLRKLQVDCRVKSEKINILFMWSITPAGKKIVRDRQEKGMLPKRD